MIFNLQCTKFMFRGGVSHIFTVCCCMLSLSNLNFASPIVFAVILRYLRMSSMSWVHLARGLGRLDEISLDLFRLVIWKSRWNNAPRRGEFAAFIALLYLYWQKPPLKNTETRRKLLSALLLRPQQFQARIAICLKNLWRYIWRLRYNLYPFQFLF